jgi:hypothetical protein
MYSSRIEIGLNILSLSKSVFSNRSYSWINIFNSFLFSNFFTVEQSLQ